LWYPAFIGVIYFTSYLGSQLAQKIEFRISNNFSGQVTVVFPVECGQTKQILNNREILYVPSDGIIYYQGELESGYINWTYKIQEKNWEQAIFEFNSSNMTNEEKDNIDSDSLGVFLSGGYSVNSFSPKPQINYKVRTLRVDKWKIKTNLK
jgi:hypothetical protein